MQIALLEAHALLATLIKTSPVSATAPGFFVYGSILTQGRRDTWQQFVFASLINRHLGAHPQHNPLLMVINYSAFLFLRLLTPYEVRSCPSMGSSRPIADVRRGPLSVYFLLLLGPLFEPRVWTLFCSPPWVSGRTPMKRLVGVEGTL